MDPKDKIPHVEDKMWKSCVGHAEDLRAKIMTVYLWRILESDPLMLLQIFKTRQYVIVSPEKRSLKSLDPKLY